MSAYSFFFLLALLSLASCSPAENLTQALKALQAERQLRGMQVQLTKDQEVIFEANLGQKNEAGDPIDSLTMFRIASVSKSFASVALMQLVEAGKLRLNQSLSELLGFKVENPHFAGQEITVEMALSHQSSLIECDPYYSNFLAATYNAKDGYEVPHIREVLAPGGSFYNDCFWSKLYPPGSHFQYVNLNFGVAGTIVEILSGQRFDLYQQQHVLQPLSEGMPETATFNPATIKNPAQLGVIYAGSEGKWTPSYDYYPSGSIPQRNLTGYRVGTNGVIYGPQGALRASASHLSRYAMLLAAGGVTKSGRRILSATSVRELLRWRYQFQGTRSGAENDFHCYGLGLFGTSFRRNDWIIEHEEVRGHTGGAYNLISAQFFWGNYTLTYIVNGALNGYKWGTGTIYEYERLAIHQAVQTYLGASSPLRPTPPPCLLRSSSS
jgi:CubicO group peptidase (beta-lactamase class C family)